jgi:hypothetical protein
MELLVAKEDWFFLKGYRKMGTVLLFNSLQMQIMLSAEKEINFSPFLSSTSPLIVLLCIILP